MILTLPNPLLFLTNIINRINLGLMAVDRDMNVCLWNGFMESHSGRKAEEIVGKNLFASFPDLPQNWLKYKIESVFLFENNAFSTWKNRPYLFPFRHNRPVTGNIDFMRQDCTFFPIRNDRGTVEYVCLAVSDVTDSSIYETQLNEALTTLEALSRVDGLTGISNRAYFEKRLRDEFKRAKRFQQNLSFLMMDLDRFKNINDTYGHLAGDEVLRTVAKEIVEEIRAIDLVGRYGGEEFAVFLPQTSREGAMAVAERIRQTVAAHPVSFDEHLISVTLSVGLTEYTPEMKTHQEMIDEADQALYQAKKEGRNRVIGYRKATD